jgi:hypothetical protein
VCSRRNYALIPHPISSIYLHRNVQDPSTCVPALSLLHGCVAPSHLLHLRFTSRQSTNSCDSVPHLQQYTPTPIGGAGVGQFIKPCTTDSADLQLDCPVCPDFATLFTGHEYTSKRTAERVAIMVAYMAALPLFWGWWTGILNCWRRYVNDASAWRVIFAC